MKKSKLLIIGIVVALVLVGGAYAVWTSQVDFSINASSGDLDVEINSVSIGNVSKYVEFGKNSVSISEDKKSANINLENLYPGASASVVLMVENTGTLPVKLEKAIQKTIKVVDTKTNKKMGHDLMKDLNVAYSLNVVNGTKRVANGTGQTVYGAHQTVTILDNSDIVLQPGESVAINMTIELSKSAEEKTENKIFSFSFTPYFVQAN